MKVRLTLKTYSLYISISTLRMPEFPAQALLMEKIVGSDVF
jgi:hypothetical protein